MGQKTKSKRRNMKQFIVLIAIQLCVFVCTVTAEEDCPAGFEFIEGIEHKCFYSHLNTAYGKFIYVTFKDALEICRGKNATVAEPKSREEGDAIDKYVKEKSNGTHWIFWINYRDIQDQASFVGEDNSVFLSSHYMGSLSTLAKMPKEWWAPSRKEGTNREKGYHCAYWSSDGVHDYPCTGTYTNSLVCETDASQNLKQYIKNLNDVVAA